MIAKTYRKKPVEIQAMQMPRDGESSRSEQQGRVHLVAEWMVASGYVEELAPGEIDDEYLDEEGRVLPEYGANYLEIETLEGTMTARPGDWIIRGVQGEFYPCKPDIFEATYDAVADV